MKSLVFDSSSIISITLNNLLWTLSQLKKQFGGQFMIPLSVKREIIDRPLQIKKYELEALQVLHYIQNETINIAEEIDLKEETDKLLMIANSCFMAHDNYIKIVHQGEIEALALAKKLDAEAVVVDERTTRTLIEDPKSQAKLLQHRLHTKIKVNDLNLKEFTKLTKGIRIIRSIELMVIAYKMGLLDRYLPYDFPDPRKKLLDSVLWGVKLFGCSVSRKEIDILLKTEL